MQIVLGYAADQGGPQAWGKALQASTKPATFESLTAVNKGSTCWIQLFDLPFDPAAARAIDDIDADGVVVEFADHGFLTGDQVDLDDGTESETAKYVRVLDKDHFTVHGSLEDARAGESNVDLSAFDPAQTEVTFAGDVEPEEYPVEANNVLSVSNFRVQRGLYVRAVTAADGSTPIAGDDVKYTPRYTVNRTT